MPQAIQLHLNLILLRHPILTHFPQIIGARELPVEDQFALRVVKIRVALHNRRRQHLHFRDPMIQAMCFLEQPHRVLHPRMYCCTDHRRPGVIRISRDRGSCNSVRQATVTCVPHLATSQRHLLRTSPVGISPPDYLNDVLFDPQVILGHAFHARDRCEQRDAAHVIVEAGLHHLHDLAAALTQLSHPHRASISRSGSGETISGFFTGCSRFTRSSSRLSKPS